MSEFDKKISALTSGSDSQAADEYVIARGGANYKITGANIAAAATKLGTIATGVWQGTAIANAYIATGLDVTKLTTGATLPSNVLASSLTSVGTLSSLTVSGDLTVDTSTLKVDSANNRVGIGTASPGAGYRLHIVDSGNTVGTNSPLFLSSANGVATTSYGWDNLTSSYDYTIKVNGSTTALTISNTGNLAVDTNTLYVDAANNRVGIGTASPTAGYQLDVIGRGRFAPTASNYLADFISPESNGTFLQLYGDNSEGALIVNGTAAKPFNLYVGGSRSLQVDTSGNLGLGVTPPASTTGISFKGPSGDAQYRLYNSTSGSTANDGVMLSLASDLKGYLWNYENEAFLFGTNNTERARITAGGNFGVNSLATNAKLEVNATSGEVFRADAGAALRIVGNQDGVVLGGNIALGVSTSFGGGSRVVAIREAETVPTTNPVGNGILYVEGGALKYRGTSGTVTTIANA